MTVMTASGKHNSDVKRVKKRDGLMNSVDTSRFGKLRLLFFGEKSFDGIDERFSEPLLHVLWW